MDIQPTTVLTPFSVSAATDADVAFQACSLAGDTFKCTGREVVVFQNTSATAQTVGIFGVEDDKNRFGDIEDYEIAAGGFAVFGVGLTTSKGWIDGDGNISITASSVDVKILVLRMPVGFPH